MYYHIKIYIIRLLGVNVLKFSDNHVTNNYNGLKNGLIFFILNNLFLFFRFCSEM